MALSAHKPLDDDETNEINFDNNDNDDHSDVNVDTDCFLYDKNTKPTRIEKIFGETRHVKDKYASHRITIRFVITLFAVYVVEGCSDWLTIATRYYGTAIWDIGPSDMQNFRSIITLPWTIKIIYGLTIDSLPLFGYKRKSYMLLFGIFAVLTTLISIIWAPHYYVQLICMTINQLSVSFCDVIADALTVERTEFKSHSVATRLQSLAWGSRYIASIVGILVSTRIELSGKPKDMLIVYWLYFFISLSIPICSILLPENKIPKKKPKPQNNEMELVSSDLSSQNAQLTDSMIMNKTQTYSIKEILVLTFQTICRKSIFYPLLFTFILRCTPSSDEALDYFLIYKLGFSSVWIGYLSVAGGVAFLISIIIITYQARESNHNFSLRKLSFIWTILAALLPFMTLVLIFGWNEYFKIPSVYFMVSDRVVVATAIDMLQMAMNVLYARICPPGIEGVFMTVLTSVSNIGLIISYQMSSAITKLLGIQCNEDVNDENKVTCDFKYLWILIIIVNLSTLLPLILIKKVPDEQELQCIGDELKNASSLTDNQSNKMSNRSRMIKLYWIVMDYIVPFIKNKICCCCVKHKKPASDEQQLELVVNANNTRPKSNKLQSNEYEEIEMR